MILAWRRSPGQYQCRCGKQWPDRRVGPIQQKDVALSRYQVYSSAMPFSASSFFAFSFLPRCIRPMPRSTLGALVN
jgi:hypothetical protein